MFGNACVCIIRKCKVLCSFILAFLSDVCALSTFTVRKCSLIDTGGGLFAGVGKLCFKGVNRTWKKGGTADEETLFILHLVKLIYKIFEHFLNNQTELKLLIFCCLSKKMFIHTYLHFKYTAELSGSHYNLLDLMFFWNTNVMIMLIVSTKSIIDRLQMCKNTEKQTKSRKNTCFPLHNFREYIFYLQFGINQRHKL